MNSNQIWWIAPTNNTVCITTAPVFICAAVYVTLSRTYVFPVLTPFGIPSLTLSRRITFLDRSLSRVNPKFFVWFFIPCDIISLVFQAAGGALSSTGNGGSNLGVNMSLFGLSFQVFTLVIFIGFSADYLIRYYRRNNGFSTHLANPRNFKIFLFFLWAAIIFILIRCVYRIDELSEGYDGALFHNEPVFYGLESVMIILAVFCLSIGQPGFGLQGQNKDTYSAPGYSAPGTEMNSLNGSKPSSV